MANTYTQLYFHVIFAVKGRKSLIQSSWKEELYKYVSGIISNNNHKLMIINGMPDHVHILMSTQANINLSDLIRDIKANSSKWINEKQLVRGKFEWQAALELLLWGSRNCRQLLIILSSKKSITARNLL